MLLADSRAPSSGGALGLLCRVWAVMGPKPGFVVTVRRGLWPWPSAYGSMHANWNRPPGAGLMRVGVWSRKHGPWDSTLLLLGTRCGGTPTVEGDPKDHSVQVTVLLHAERPGVFLASPAPG